MRIWKVLLVVVPLFFAFVSSGPAFAGGPSPTPTAIPTDEPSPTATPTPTAIPTDEPSPTATATPTDEPSPTATATPTDEPTAEPTAEVEDELAFTGSNTGPATVAGVTFLLAGLGFLVSARRRKN